MQSIQWNARHRVFVNREFSVAFVKTVGGYQEFDDYREHGGQVIARLLASSEEVGTFTNAEISNMDYPE